MKSLFLKPFEIHFPKILTIVIILSVGLLGMNPFLQWNPTADAHPSERWLHFHLVVCAEWDGQYHTYCDHRWEFSTKSSDPEEDHPSSENDPDHNAHDTVGLPDVYTSELERVDDCSDCSTWS